MEKRQIIQIMKPIVSFKKWLLNILVLLQRAKTRKKRKKMSLIYFGIVIEIFLLGIVFLWVKKLKSKQSRQPSLSKKTIKNLKFQDFDHKIRKLYKEITFIGKLITFPSHFVYEIGQNIHIVKNNMVSSIQGLAPITNPLNSVLIDTI